MQKRIIALAVAGLVSGAAFAQSSVTIYGVADVSDVYASDNYTAHTKSANSIQSGSAGASGSRIGFKGVEDLGNGLSANFRFEGGLNLDTGTSAQGGQLMGRWSTVGLSSKEWGGIEAGRRESFSYQLLVPASGNGRGTIAGTNTVYLAQDRFNNMIAYTSPSWSGLQFKAGYASNGTDPTAAQVTANTTSQDVAPTQINATADNIADNTNLRVYTGAVTYTNGPLLIGAVADYNHYQNRDSSVAGDAGSGSYKGGNVWNIAGAYDFGIVRIDAALGAINYANNVQFKEKKDSRTQWTVGAVVPFGTKDRIILDYAHANISYLASTNHRDDALELWGAVYKHDLSKRTTLYASYAAINQDNDGLNKATLYGVTSGYQQAVQVGLNHTF